MHLLEVFVGRESISDLIRALLNVWEYGKGPSFHVAYGRYIWIGTADAISLSIAEDS